MTNEPDLIVFFKKLKKIHNLPILKRDYLEEEEMLWMLLVCLRVLGYQVI